MSRTLGPADRAEALAAFTDLERQRAEVTPVDRRDDFLAGRLLLRRLVAELTGEEFVPLVAVCADCGGPHGAPTLPHSTLRLSLSHGAGIVVAAASRGARIGVDVEALDRPDALTAIGVVAGEPTLKRWTRVEAILKADGRGLRVDPAEVEIDGDIGRVRDASARYALAEHELAPGVRVSVAVEL